LVAQDKNKYNSPKYRLVVRITNRFTLAQVVYSKIQGDVVMAQASSQELPEYGVKVGLGNWAAAYCTGLLVARRLLTKVGLADKYEGVAEPDGTFSEVEPLDDGPRPFKVFLDVGLHRTSTGAKIFAVMKGASDGGLYVPHNEKRLPGYDASEKSLDAEVVRDYIFGENIAEYMRFLEEDDEELFKRQFASYLAEELTADDLEEMYTEAHQKIRENPVRPAKKYTPEQIAEFKKTSKAHRQQKITYEQKRAKVAAAKKEFLESLQ
jgi:large subunit ribosomal protein L5e